MDGLNCDEATVLDQLCKCKTNIAQVTVVIFSEGMTSNRDIPMGAKEYLAQWIAYGLKTLYVYCVCVFSITNCKFRLHDHRTSKTNKLVLKTQPQAIKSIVNNNQQFQITKCKSLIEIKWLYKNYTNTHTHSHTRCCFPPVCICSRISFSE